MSRPKGSKNKPKITNSEALFNQSTLISPEVIDESKYRWYVIRENGIMKSRYFFNPEDALKLDIIKKFLTQTDAIQYILLAQPQIDQT